MMVLFTLASQINYKPTNGILIDPVYGENVITKEFLIFHELYQDTYDRLKEWLEHKMSLHSLRWVQSPFLYKLDLKN
jgi:predicted N-acyltransferase